MRAVTMLYFIALGWYLRYSGLDAEVAQAARQAWDLAVAHTARVAARQRTELAFADDGAAAPAEPNWEAR